MSNFLFYSIFILEITFCSVGNIYASNRILVKFNHSQTALEKKSLYLQSKVNRVRHFKSMQDLELHQFFTADEAKRALALYQKNAQVIYAEQDYRVKIADTPNDEHFPLQWGLHNMGLANGVNDTDINAPEAWNLISNNYNAVIAIIDTGVDYSHPDLIKNLWVNPNEIAGNQIDDDENGYIDDIYGVNMIDGTGNPSDENNHGTHVAGIIAATKNNRIGISGVTQDTKIISCKFLDSFGSGNISDAIACLDYIANLKTNVIATNNSWGGNDRSKALYESIASHLKKGILFITAAGNNNADNDQKEFYPSNYLLPNVISVAAIDQNGYLANFSNYGRYKVHVAAPGVNILSTIVQSYDEMDGTSMATPFVTGLVGLIKSSDPHANWSQIKNRIISSGKSLKNLQGITLTGKLVRAYDDQKSGALNCENQILTAHISPSSNATSFEIGTKVMLSAININCGESLGSINAVIDNKEKFVLPDDGTKSDLVAYDGLATREWIPSILGTFQFRFSETDVALINIYDPSNWKKYSHPSTPEFKYRTISGIQLQTSDESVSILNSPFAFPFAGGKASQFILYIGSNGTISLTDGLLANFYNLPFPEGRWTTLIAPYWDDLTPIENNTNSGIFYETLGEEPDRELVIEWRNMLQYRSTNNHITFQIIFFENSPDILFNYLDITSENIDHSDGASATIGIQTKPNLHQLFSLNAANISSKRSLLFKPETTDNNSATFTENKNQKLPLDYMRALWITISKQH
jgi:Subtilase family